MSRRACNGVASAILDDTGGSSADSASFKRGGRYRVPRNASPGNLPPYEESIIAINVAGLRFQTFDSTLRRFPDSLLGNVVRRKKYWNAQTKEYFFDRHRDTFTSILHIYQTGGQVLRPQDVPITLYLQELRFYGFGAEILENFWESEGYKKPVDDVMPTNKYQRMVWKFIEHPDSSIFARILAFVSVSVIIISIATLCLETLPELQPPDDEEREWHSPFFWIELFCCIFFSIELTLRFISCPNKTRFLKSFLNILDFVAVAPFFISLIAGNGEKGSSGASISFSVLRVVRLIRVFRIFKLSRHSVGLQVLGKTFKASVREFFLLLFFMAIAMILFSSGIYFAEQNEPDTKFTSIPASFWFVLATMTTVGYGDLVPHGLYGKIVGSMCALIGVLTLALPVPIIVANFKHFYRQECRLAQMYAQSTHGALGGCEGPPNNKDRLDEDHEKSDHEISEKGMAALEFEYARDC